jgi:hypothetical protein
MQALVPEKQNNKITLEKQKQNKIKIKQTNKQRN